MSPPPPNTKPKPPLKFGKPEKRNWTTTILMWSFIAVVLIAIIWMIASNPREKAMVCSSSGQTSLIGFGGCSQE